MKKCPYCQSEIDDKASVCPVCKRTIKGKKFFKFCLAFFIFSFMSFIIASIVGPGEGTKNEYITKEEFLAIKPGMTYEEVANIVGSPGEIMAESGADGYKIHIIAWYGDSTSGANANVTFINGKVDSKAQVGLK